MKLSVEVHSHWGEGWGWWCQRVGVRTKEVEPLSGVGILHSKLVLKKTLRPILTQITSLTNWPKIRTLAACKP